LPFDQAPGQFLLKLHKTTVHGRMADALPFGSCQHAARAGKYEEMLESVEHGSMCIFANTFRNLAPPTFRGGAAAVADLLAGHVQVMFDVIPESIEHIKAGRLRVLAVTSRTRANALPEIPTVGDFVPGYETINW
jgi:hypothetical protein